MQNITTLTEFLEAGGASPRCYDMGRRITSLPSELFLSFERAETAYPQPLQQQAWFALLLEPGDGQSKVDQLIWFLRFPLDEQGKLLQAARDDFMLQLIETLGSASQPIEQNQEMETALRQSPYAYQPKQERLAALHAKVTVELGQAPSRFYEHAKTYFDGQLEWDQWSFIGYQGIADVAARCGLDGNADRLAAAIPHLPPVPLEALCHCLENEAIPESLARVLHSRAKLALQALEPDPQVITAILRGMSNAVTESCRHDLLQTLLAQPIGKRSDILAAVAGRMWEELSENHLRRQFLECLADSDQDQPFFNQILSDLLFLPATRPCMLESLREPGRSDRLSTAIGAFFKNIRNQG